MNNMQISNRILRDKFAFSQTIKLHLIRLNCHYLRLTQGLSLWKKTSFLSS